MRAFHPQRTQGGATLILFALEPSLVDERLDDRWKEYPRFLLMLCPTPVRSGIGMTTQNGEKGNMPYNIISALKSGLKTAKRLQKDQTRPEKD